MASDIIFYPVSQRKILDTLNVQSISDANAVKEMESELETVRNFLELHIDRMLRLPAIPESYETNRTYVLWASLLLVTMNDKNWSLLHQLLSRRGMTDPTLRPLSLRYVLTTDTFFLPGSNYAELENCLKYKIPRFFLSQQVHYSFVC